MDFEFIFGLALLKIVLHAIRNWSSFAQSLNVDIWKVEQTANLVISSLECCRLAESFDAVRQLAEQWSEHVKGIIDEEDIPIGFKEAKLPQQRKPSKRRQSLIGESSDGIHQFPKRLKRCTK